MDLSLSSSVARASDTEPQRGDASTKNGSLEQRHRSEPSWGRCVASLLATVVLLRAIGLERTLVLVERLSNLRMRVGQDSSDSPETDPPDSRRYLERDRAVLASTTARISTVAAIVPARALCLEQSIAVYWCARWLGFPVQLRIGVEALPFTAHAWVEYRGVPISEIDERLQRVAPILEWPQSRARRSLETEHEPRPSSRETMPERPPCPVEARDE